MDNIKKRALDLLALRDHSCVELERKLVRKGFSSGDANDVCQQLVAAGILNDLSFSCNYLRARSSLGYGCLKVKSELIRKGITAEVISQSFDDCVVNWHTILVKVWQKKFNTMPVDANEYAKQQRFLLQRGFLVEDINRLLVIEHCQIEDV